MKATAVPMKDMKVLKSDKSLVNYSSDSVPHNSSEFAMKMSKRLKSSIEFLKHYSHTPVSNFKTNDYGTSDRSQKTYQSYLYNSKSQTRNKSSKARSKNGSKHSKPSSSLEKHAKNNGNLSGCVNKSNLL